LAGAALAGTFLAAAALAFLTSLAALYIYNSFLN